jgi:Ca2+-binding RTX toxin-like protein
MKTRQLFARRLFARFRTAAMPHRIDPPRLPVRFVERLESRIAPAVDAFLIGGVVTFTGDGADDTLAFTTTVEATSGKVVLMHNRFSAGDPGFASDTDLDSSMPGIQSMAVSDLTQVNVNAGGGNDTVKLGDDRSPASALPPAFMLDGGGGINGFVVNWKSDLTGRAAVINGTDISGISAANGGVWHVASFARIDLFGGLGGDTFDVMSTAAGMPVILDGGDGSDTYRVRFGNLAAPVTLADSGARLGDADSATLIGTDGGDEFLIGLLNVARGNEVVNFLPFQGFEAFTLLAGAGNDTISVTKLASGPALTLDGEGGTDTYLIGLLRTGTSSNITINDTGASATETDHLTLTGTADSDTFMINGALLTATDPSNGTDSLVVTLTGLESLSAFGGSGADTYFCQNNLVPAVLDGQGGGDIYGITFGGSFAGPITIGDTGADLLPDILTMLGTDNADTFVGGAGKVVFNQTQTLQFGAQGSGVEQATLNGLGGSDAFFYGTGVYNTGLTGGVHTTILGGLGADSFTLTATPGPDDNITFDGQSDSDTYTILFGELTAPVMINDTGAGPASDNQVIAIGTDGSDHFTISAGQIVFQDEKMRPPQVVIFFGDVGSLKFDGALGNDTFTLFKLGVPVDLFGGAGNDTFSILGTDAPVTIDGQEGGDTTAIQLGATRGAITLTDTGTPGADRLFLSGTIGADSFTVFATKIDWSGPGDEGPEESVTFLFGQLYKPAQIVIDARAGNDTLNVMSTAAGTTLLVEGGDGIDSFGAELPLLSGKVTLADHEFAVPGSVLDPDTIYHPDTLTVFGSDDADTIVATDTRVTHQDHILDFTGIGVVEILAGKGDDHVSFSSSALLPAVQKVRISGGEGNDTIRDSSGPGHSRGTDNAVIAIILEGDDGNDMLTGGSFANTIGGGAGDDIIKGGAGDDVLSGGLGFNTIGGAAGHDTVIEEGDFDWMVTNSKITGAGTDKLSGIERAHITGGDGANKIDALKFSGQFTAIGGAGDDLILGGRGNDFLTGGLGANTIGGAAGFDTVIEEADADFTLVGNTKSATLDGPGDDLLLSIARVMVTGGDSANVLDASAFRGSVALFGMGGNDLLRGGFGNDILSGGLGANTIGGAAGIDTLIEEGDANFTLSDTLLNGPGSDVLDGIEIAMLTGGESDNTIDANTWTGRVVLTGLGGDDHLTGGTGNDVLLGGDGDDVLIGGKGLDRLVGGPGKNTLTQ